MIIKVQDHELNDKFLIEAELIRYAEADTILEIHKSSESVDPDARFSLASGDNVYIMNDAGKTVDCKHIVPNKIDASKNEVLSLIRTAWEQSPEEGLLELLGSCFAAGDVSHIADDELKTNLNALIEVEAERKRRNSNE